LIADVIAIAHPKQRSPTMKSSSEKPAKQKRIRGPKRIEFVPEPMRGIEGVGEVTTVRQLVRLQEYLATAHGQRMPFVRLGASVPAKKGRRKVGPSATYAVDVEGRVAVIRKSGDPRRTHLWVQNERRPWNLCRDSRFGALHTVSATNVRVVTLAVFDVEGDTAPAWLGEELPQALRPDGTITRVWTCHSRKDAGGADREFVVEGFGTWWEGRAIDDLVAIREAYGKIVSAEGGTLWVTSDRVIEFPAYGYADNEMLLMVGEVCTDPMEYLRRRLAEKLRLRVRSEVTMANHAPSDTAIRSAVRRAVESLDIRTASLADVGALQAELIAALIDCPGVCA